MFKQDAQSLQMDLNPVTEWLMQLNINKCKVMHFGMPLISYSMATLETLNGNFVFVLKNK